MECSGGKSSVSRTYLILCNSNLRDSENSDAAAAIYIYKLNISRSIIEKI
jgi:hypothetical protein